MRAGARVTRTSLPFPHPPVLGTTPSSPGLAADEDFHGHLTDASRSRRSGTRCIAPGSFATRMLARARHRDGGWSSVRQLQEDVGMAGLIERAPAGEVVL